MKQSALESVFTFRGRVIGLDNYKGKDFMSKWDFNNPSAMEV